MKQGIQDTFEKGSPIQKWGCYFLSLCEWAFRSGAPDYSKDAALILADKALQSGFIDKEFTVLNPVKLLAMLNGPVFKSVSHVKDEDENTCVVCNKKPGHTHFTLRYNGEIWDPLTPDRPGVKDYKIDSIRRFV